MEQTIVNVSSEGIVGTGLSQIKANFNKCVHGYHLVNVSSINETVWEDINALVFTSVGIEVFSKSDGSHSPGMDIQSSIGGLSNKSAKYSKNNKSFDISSYRLTTVCDGKNCGTPAAIIEEINSRKNFTYYSFMVRDELSVEGSITYDWILIPSDHPLLNPALYTWEPTVGKRGKGKDVQVGWNTNVVNGCSMKISFSMSSQLWMHIEMTEELKKYVIASSTVSNKPTFNYIQLFDKENL